MTTKHKTARKQACFQPIRNKTYFFQRDSAAFLAIAFRFLADRLLARAFPPFNPPFLPISARYCWTGERSSSFGSSTESRTISAARSIGSLGSFLERIMHPLLAQKG